MNTFTVITTGIDRTTSKRLLTTANNLVEGHRGQASRIDVSSSPRLRPVTVPNLQLVMLTLLGLHQSGQDITVQAITERIAIKPKACEHVLSHTLSLGNKLLLQRKPGSFRLTARGTKVTQAWFERIFQGHYLIVNPRRLDLCDALRRQRGLVVIDRKLRYPAVPHDISSLILMLTWVAHQFGQPASVKFITERLHCPPSEVYQAARELREKKSSVLKITGTSSRDIMFSGTPSGLNLAQHYISGLLE